MKSSLISKFFPAGFLLLAGLLPAHNLFAQVSRQWVKFYEDLPNSQNTPRGIVADDWGNVYVTGYSALPSNGINNSGDFVTIKYNAAGAEEWVARFDGSSVPAAITIDKSGYVYVTGPSLNSDGNDDDYATIKYNSQGVKQWVAFFKGPDNSNDTPFDIKVDDDGGVYVVGCTGVADIALVKYNSNGVQQWQQYYNGPGNDVDLPLAMALNPVNADVYITGYVTTDNSQHEYVTIRYNSSGVRQWVRFYNGSTVANTLDEAENIAVDAQGNAYVGGNSVSSDNIYGSVTIKYNAAGEVVWVQRFTGPANMYAQQNDLAIDKLGNVYITGYIGDNSGLRSATIKYNTDGVEQWMQLNDLRIDNWAKALALDSAGNVYITGISDGADVWNTHFFTIKYNAGGEKEWMEEYEPTSDWDQPEDIAVNRFGDVFVSGLATKGHIGYFTISNYVTIKYAQVQPLVVKATPDTSVYYGYGSNCVQLTAEASGGTAPYSFTWSIGTKNNSTIVCPTTTSVYSVTVKDVNGLIATGQVTVKVIDVRCDTRDKKIVVCHNGKDLCISANSVASHLQHGDILGNCRQGTTSVKRENETNRTKPAFAIYPNPMKNTSTVYYSAQDEAYVTIILMDVTGKEIKTVVQGRKLPGFYTTVINANGLAPGMYLCRMTAVASGAQSSYILKIIVGK